MRRDYYRTAATARFEGVIDKGTAVAIMAILPRSQVRLLDRENTCPVWDQPYEFPIIVWQAMRWIWLYQPDTGAR